MTPSRWRTPALVALWLQVASVFGLASYALTSGNYSVDAWIYGGMLFLSALVLWWWTQLFSRLSLGQGILPTDGVLRSFALFFPLLTIYRAFRWIIVTVALLNGLAVEANSVALTAMMTVWGALVFAENAMYGHTLNVALEPGNLLARTRLLEWLNVSAALSLGMTVINMVPIRGFGPETLNPTAQLLHGASGVLDVIATVLAFLALMPQKPQVSSQP